MPELSRSLKSRPITRISILGIISAGRFLGSSATIAAAGAAIIVSRLTGTLVLRVMRRLAGAVGPGAERT